MELFPSSDEESWAIIERVIDESDVYLLIIAGRYGSMHPKTKVGYTEMEFDYAQRQGKPILLFVHGDPGSLPAKKSEESASTKRKLSKFISKAARDRNRRTWLDANSLRAEVGHALDGTFTTRHLVGWTRADGQNNNKLLQQIADMESRMQSLRDENEVLKSRLGDTAPIDGSSTLDDELELSFEENIWNYNTGITTKIPKGSKVVSVRDLFMKMAELLVTPWIDNQIPGYVGRTFAMNGDLTQNSFLLVRRKFIALRLIKVVEDRRNVAKEKGTQTVVNDAWTLDTFGQKIWLQEASKSQNKI